MIAGVYSCVNRQENHTYATGAILHGQAVSVAIIHTEIVFYTSCSVSLVVVVVVLKPNTTRAVHFDEHFSHPTLIPSWIDSAYFTPVSYTHLTLPTMAVV